MRSIVTTALEVAGVVLVVGGLWLLSVPVALIAAGSAIILGCWRLAS